MLIRGKMESQIQSSQDATLYYDVAACAVCKSERLEPWGKEVEEYRLVRCSRCGFVCVGRRPTTSAIAEYYSSPSQYDRWEAELEPRRKMWMNRLGLLKKMRLRGSLLDVGTGIGQFLALARPLVDRVSGTEVSRSACEAAKRLYNLDVRHGILEDISFAERFDVITLFHVVEHVDDPSVTLSTCVRLLNDHGLIAMAVPNEIKGFRFVFTRLLCRMAPGLVHRPFFTPPIDLSIPDHEVHLNYFTPQSATRLFEASGLEVQAILLDPYYPAKNNAITWAKRTWYRMSRAVKGLTGYVCFDAFIVVGRKRPNSR
jgi:2-polyprenyl-3-methyl-5-hydroxy-6-metoxy-1,4-benzoquinol methylase